MVPVHGEEGEQGQHIDKLAHQGELLGGLGVKDVGGGKPHLVADDRTAEGDGGEHQLGHQTDEHADEHLVDDQQAKGGQVEGHPGGVGGHGREEQQGGGEGQDDLALGRDAAAGKGRDGGN